MAHLVKLNQADFTHNNSIEYLPVLFNLDTVISIEPYGKNHSVIYTTRNNVGVRVKESLEDILKLSKNYHNELLLD